MIGNLSVIFVAATRNNGGFRKRYHSNVRMELMNVIPPFIQTTLTIAISAIGGAIAIIVVRGIYERRRLLAALHAELVDNFFEFDHRREKIGKDPDQDARTILSGTYSRAAFDAIRVNDPILYLNLDSSSKNIRDVYRVIGTWEKLNQNPPFKVSVGSSDQGQQTHPKAGQDEDKTDEISLSEAVDNVYEVTFDAINDVEMYVSESLLRRIFYWRCLGVSPDELQLEKTD